MHQLRSCYLWENEKGRLHMTDTDDGNNKVYLRERIVWGVERIYLAENLYYGGSF